MDVQRLKYNIGLMKTKSRLEKELNMINQEIKTQQESCSHVRVYLGQESSTGNFYNECLFCGIKQLSCNLQVPTIVAYKFKSEIYGTGETEEKRERRMEEIRNLYTEFFQENESEEELITSFTKHIERGTL